MAEDNKVVADLRDQFGKGFARRLRAAGKIPAVLYGHGTDPVHVALPGHQVALLVRRANALLDLEIAGKAQLALVKDVQRDPVTQIIEHIDLLVVKKGEKIQVDVPVVVWGELLDGEVEHHGVQHPGTERDGVEPDVVEASRRVVLPLDLDDADRAAVLAGSCALVATSTGANYPWRVIEALTMGVPVVAAASDTHRETVLEAGLVVDVDRLPDALAQVLRDEETRDRFAIRAADRGRGFSWWDHGTRVWALHAEL